MLIGSWLSAATESSPVLLGVRQAGVEAEDDGEETRGAKADQTRRMPMPDGLARGFLPLSPWYWLSRPVGLMEGFMEG